MVIGGVGGWLIGRLFRRGAIPAHLKSPLLLVLVLLVYVQGNMSLPDREQLVSFKESLTVLLLSSLFVIIPAQFTFDEFQLIDWRIVAFVLVVMFVVRPATVLLSTAAELWRPLPQAFLAQRLSRRAKRTPISYCSPCSLSSS